MKEHGTETGGADKQKRHNKTKRGLKIIGICLTVGGLACTVAGSVSFFSALGSGELPKLFWLLMIGLPMMTIGVAMLTFGFRKEIGTYIKDETVPVVNEAGTELTPAVKAVAQAAAEGMTAQNANGQKTCPACGAENGADKNFCEACGTPLTATCPHCGSAVGAGAAFCGNCGKKL